MTRSRSVPAILVLAALTAGLLAVAAPYGAAPQLRAGFGVRAITPVGTPPAEWAQYLHPHPATGVWGERFVDRDGDGCMSGLTNHNLEPILDGKPPRGQTPEPHIDDPWNHTGDGYKTGGWSVRGVTIVGDPDSAGKWDGLWANAGFGSKCTLGAKDDTWARAVVLDMGGETVAMVSLDVVGLFNLEIQRLRDEIKARYPALPDIEIVVSSTHTHEGVDTMGFWGQLFLNTDGKFPAYQAFLRSQILDAIADAYAAREPAKVKLAVGTQTTGLRDSRPPYVMDAAVPAAQFVRPSDGSTIGTVVNWSNHPEAQGSNNQLVSSDFPHGAREELEAKLGGTAVYFSGSVGGLQTPLGAHVPGFGSSVSWARTYEIGRLVAEAAMDALATAPAIEVPSLTVKRRAFYIEGDNMVLNALNARGIFDIPTYVGGESWGPPAGHADGVRTGLWGPQFQTEMVSVEMGPAMFLTVPGELSPEIEIGGYGRGPDSPYGDGCAAADTGRPYEPVIADQFSQPVQFVLGLGQDELGYIIPGYDFWVNAVGRRDDGTSIVNVGGLEAVDPCGEGHYEETVSASSALAPWVACIAKELAGKDPWDLSDPANAACAYDNMNRPPYGIDPLG